jgi:hypothetical protein
MNLNAAQTPSTADDWKQLIAKTSQPQMIFRRLLVWIAVAMVSAVPSFLLAIVSGHQNWPAYVAMLLGILLFAFMLATISASSRFRDRLERPFVRRSMQIGFGLRILASLVVPIGFSLDMFPGMLTTMAGRLVAAGIGLDLDGFLITFLQTLIQGSLLNIEILLVVAGARVFQIAFLTWRPRSEDACLKCGYHLEHANPHAGAACPECGSTAGPIGQNQDWVDRVSLTRLSLSLIAGLLVAFSIQGAIGMVTALVSENFG